MAHVRLEDLNKARAARGLPPLVIPGVEPEEPKQPRERIIYSRRVVNERPRGKLKRREPTWLTALKFIGWLLCMIAGGLLLTVFSMLKNRSKY